MQKTNDHLAYAPMPRVRILIVDDDATHLSDLCRSLQGHGYEAVGLDATPAALAALGESKFDVLITNLTMPDIDGIGLLQAALQIDPSLAGIAMTGEGTITSAVEAIRAGALDYLPKPFRFGEIEQVLTRALAVTQLRRENAILEQSRRTYALELESVNKELEAFGVAISHDLAAPLRAIAAFGELLAQRSRAELAPESQCYLDFINKKIAHMQHLTTELLKFYQLGRQPLSLSPIHVSALVEMALEDFRFDPAFAHTKVIIGHLPDCVGDPILLQQVYANLLSNAYKFSSRKPLPQVEVGCESTATGNVYFVRDNGTGFNTDHAGQLFVAFRRLHSQVDYPGTGVGLAMVRHIVERHGGKIWAATTIGEGCTFHFTLGNENQPVVSPSSADHEGYHSLTAAESVVFSQQLPRIAIR